MQYDIIARQGENRGGLWLCRHLSVAVTRFLALRRLGSSAGGLVGVPGFLTG
jgi:hypothetical protein